MKIRTATIIIGVLFILGLGGCPALEQSELMNNDQTISDPLVGNTMQVGYWEIFDLNHF